MQHQHHHTTFPRVWIRPSKHGNHKVIGYPCIEESTANYIWVRKPKDFYTARNAQVSSKSVAGLLPCCHQANILRCVRIACSGLMITSLLQVVNRYAPNWLSDILPASLFQQLAASLQNIKLQQVWFSPACYDLMKSADLVQLADNLQQAGKTHNLQQVCDVSCCAKGLYIAGWQPIGLSNQKHDRRVIYKGSMARRLINRGLVARWLVYKGVDSQKTYI